MESNRRYDDSTEMDFTVTECEGGELRWSGSEQGLVTSFVKMVMNHKSEEFPNE